MHSTLKAHRFELFGGTVVVTVPPDPSHIKTVYQLRRVLERQAPTELAVLTEGWGVCLDENTLFIPDLLVTRQSVLVDSWIKPKDALLAVEVVAKTHPSNDFLLKRHIYAEIGIPEYWIVDAHGPGLTVLRPTDDSKGYQEVAFVRPGDRWADETPFRLDLDPAEIF